MNKIVNFRIVFLLFLLFVNLTGCQKKNRQENYILFTLDTQRADHLSCYNPDNAQTPNLDFLASEGILYENCYSLTPITLPSHASIFFSQPPHQLRSYNNGHTIRKKRNRPSFVNVFRKKGYSTAAFISLGTLMSKYGLDEGFGLYDDEFPEGDWYLAAEDINQKVFPWLEKNKQQKFFLWVHYSDPHEPYYPPDSPPDLEIYLNGHLLGKYNLDKRTDQVELDLKQGLNQLKFELVNNFIPPSSVLRAKFEKLSLEELEDEQGVEVEFKEGWIFRKEDKAIFLNPQAFVDIINHSEPRKLMFSLNGNILLPFEMMRENYKKDVEYMDRQFGEFLEKLKHLGLMEKTHIMIVGDHGESLGDYINYNREPHFGHIFFLYDVYMKVPLIVYNPFSDKRGIRIKEPVSLLDIAPTIMDTLGFNRFPHFKGERVNGLNKKEDSFIFQETYKPQAIRDKFAVLCYPLHLIYTPDSGKYELYDLESDPGEKNNIYDEKRKLDKIVNMERILEGRVRQIIKDKIEIQIDKDTEGMLKTLGYIK